MRELRIAAMREALAETGNNVAQAAKLLGVSRKTLYRMMEEGGVRLEIIRRVRATRAKS